MVSNNTLGLTNERYTQMLKTYNGSTAEVESVVSQWGAEACNKGYGEFDYDGIGLICIEAISDVGVFLDDELAVRAAVKDGVQIIPVEQLPVNMPSDMRFYGWVDTESNRTAIATYCLNLLLPPNYQIKPDTTIKSFS